MMQHVVLFNFFPDAAFKVKMVYGVVGYIIYQVAQYKAGKKSPDIIYG